MTVGEGLFWLISVFLPIICCALTLRLRYSIITTFFINITIIFIIAALILLLEILTLVPYTSSAGFAVRIAPVLIITLILIHLMLYIYRVIK